MNRLFPIWLTVLVLMTVGLSTCAEGLEPIGTKLLAAMPIMKQGMTQLAISTGSGESRVFVSRAITPYALVRGSANTSGSFDLRMRLWVPLELAPAFLSVELGPTSVTGLMTLFFGPVSIDLGRTWFTPSRWALVQFVVHPRLTMVIGGFEKSEKISPQIGWRLFPARSARWEIGMMFDRDGIRLSLGGIL